MFFKQTIPGCQHFYYELTTSEDNLPDFTLTTLMIFVLRVWRDRDRLIHTGKAIDKFLNYGVHLGFRYSYKIDIRVQRFLIWMSERHWRKGRPFETVWPAGMVSSFDYMYLVNHLELYIDLYLWKNRRILQVWHVLYTEN